MKSIGVFRHNLICDKSRSSHIQNRRFENADFEQECDECRSTHIIYTGTSYICAECGLELDTPRFEYYRPFNPTKLQHSQLLLNTMIGYKSERNSCKNSRDLHRRNALHIRQDRSIEKKAYSIIKHLISNLKLKRDCIRLILEDFKFIREKFPPKGMFRAPRNIIPGLIFVFCVSNNKNVPPEEIIEFSGIEPSLFKRSIYKIQEHMSKYVRDKEALIQLGVFAIQREFGLNHDFFCKAIALRNYFRGVFLGRKGIVVASILCSLIALSNYTYYRKRGININAISEVLEISDSHINSCITAIALNVLKIDGFSTPVASHTLIAESLSEKGMINSNANKKKKINKKNSVKELDTKTKGERENQEIEPSGIEIKNSPHKPLRISIIAFFDHHFSINWFIIIKNNLYILIRPFLNPRGYYKHGYFGFTGHKGPPCYCIPF